MLQFKYQTLTPTLSSSVANPQIDFKNSPFSRQLKLEKWHSQTPRLAGLSSFGIGGANSHFILEEGPTHHLENHKNNISLPYICTISAKNERALTSQKKSWLQYISRDNNESLHDICLSSNQGRKHFQYRWAATAENIDDLKSKLQKDARMPHSGRTSQKTAFLFTGQGAQCNQMGFELYQTYPVFKKTIDECEDILEPLLEHKLSDIIFVPEGHKNAPLIHQTAYTQPCLFAIEYALFQLWQSWGVKADIVVGHSVGEIVALCAAGIVSLEDGLRWIAKRGQLMQNVRSQGTMLAVIAPPNDLAQHIQEHHKKVSVAAHNGPKATVLSGDSQHIQSIQQALKKDGIVSQCLQVSHAFHSHHMDPMLDEYLSYTETIPFHEGNIPFISCVDGAMHQSLPNTNKYFN
ncbi:MAG TPA: acyltransferase domain-containing protein, partial [Flavobacteriales bacterium]|nr:acyltransferase domain-containing protein [Flavobacteriales bacterium]